MGIDDIIEEQARAAGVTPPSVRERQRQADLERQREEADVVADGGQPSVASTLPDLSVNVGETEVSLPGIVEFLEANPELAQVYLLAFNSALLLLLLWKV